MRTDTFIRDVLASCRKRAARFWLAEQVEQIEQDHKDLVVAYRADAIFHGGIDNHSYCTELNAAWDENDPQSRKFPTLWSFVDNLATIFANTASVESEFGILKAENFQFRTTLGHLALEGIFQAKQVETIRSLYAMLHQ